MESWSQAVGRWNALLLPFPFPSSNYYEYVKIDLTSCNELHAICNGILFRNVIMTCGPCEIVPRVITQAKLVNLEACIFGELKCSRASIGL